MTTVEEAAAVEPAQRATAATGFATGLIGLAAAGVALLSALVTFLVMADLTPISPTHNVVLTLLAVNTLTVALLVIIIGREVWHIVQARRRGRAAGRLHVQIIVLFSVIAAVPVLGNCRGARRAGCWGRQHDARPGARSAVLQPHSHRHPKLDDCIAGLSQ
jgi:two-component system nitrogen regulation sensor histidine kinase NtrY